MGLEGAGYTSGSIQNTGTAVTDITVTFRNPDGTMAGSPVTFANVLPNTMVRVTPFDAGLVVPWTGSATATAAQPLAGEATIAGIPPPSPMPTPTSTPTTTPTPTPPATRAPGDHLFLPAVLRYQQPTPMPTPTPTRENIVVNGDFESGPDVGWTEFTDRYELIDTNHPHTGSYAADECNYNDCMVWIEQTVTIPANAMLNYWWYVSSSDSMTSAHDYLKIELYRLDGSLLATLRTWNNTSQRNVYSLDTLSLSAYAGQTVQLRITGLTDGSLSSRYFIDDVSIR
jgi:hypothetical protein